LDTIQIGLLASFFVALLFINRPPFFW